MASVSQRRNNLVLGGIGLVAASVATVWIFPKWHRSRRDKNEESNASILLTAHEQLIERGTPLIELKRVTKLIGRSVFAKMESMNPGGTGKDRAALNMIRMAEKEGKLPPPADVVTHCDDSLFLNPSLPVFPYSTHDSDGTNTKMQHTHEIAVVPTTSAEKELENMVLQALEKSRTGGLVVEGTSGSTGIALATLCAARGHACLVVLPDDQAVEKQRILRSLGAVVYEVPTAAISNPKHYVNLGRKLAMLARDKFGVSAVFVDQFENLSNFDIHYRQTGPELLRQLKQQGRSLDAFVMSSGTGGTIAGIATYLKEQHITNNNNNDVQIVLVDPPGSALYHKVEHGVAFAAEQRERYLRKHRYDTLAEGIGLDRITRNFSSGLSFIDRSIRVTDQEAVDMAHWILRTEGLWIGSSSAMNLVGAIKTALALPEGSSVVTMVCDGGQRHATRFWNPKFIGEWGLQWPSADCIPDCLEK
uniref:Tryptophan synthase beta chain-like PALP domain-containing protein n=1 Tax=Pseudo-nitzschia australis TaxID=44445 RepID=A0A7S4AR20_9STRA|mmetsp:Transcript_4547/g.9927  ORF Transcript_4547/g.9927 Transcript_4547/m.9927 type:complete len:475 (+) Transcript_4547:133-1557(+)